MSDWRFALNSGYLTWTTPSLPNEGQLFYTDLSPTLIAGYQENGDALPLDYISVADITSAKLSPNGLAIELEVQDAAPILLVAQDTNEAQKWLASIQLARSGEDASPAQQQPAASPNVQIAAKGLDVASAPRDDRAITDSLKASKFQPPTSAAAAPQQQQQPPLAAASAATTTMNASKQPPQPPPQPTTVAGGERSNNGSFGSIPMVESIAFGLPGGESNAQNMPPPPAVMKVLSLQVPSMTITKDPKLAPTSAPPPPPPSAPTTTTVNMGGSMAANNNMMATSQRSSAMNTPRGQPGLVENPNNNVIDEPQCSKGPSGAHEFRPLAEIMGSGNSKLLPSGTKAQTTTYTTNDQIRRPLTQMPPPQYPARTSSSFQQQQQQQQQAFSGGGASPNPNFGAASPPSELPSMIRATSQQQQQQAFSQGQQQSPFAVPPQQQSNNYGGGSEQQQQQQQVFRKRSGMMVRVPPTANLNRNVAPNVSAIWKKWIGPDKNFYVCHEATGTIQRLDPETGEFETLAVGNEDLTDEDLAARPQFTDEDPTLDLNTQTVHNVQNYGVRRDVGANITAMASTVLRSGQITSPPSSQSRNGVNAYLAAAAGTPRSNQASYTGRRVHHVTLASSAQAPEDASIEHEIQTLGAQGLRWDPTSGITYAPNPQPGQAPQAVGMSTLQRQWEHVRKILMQGRYFRKHALRSNVTSYRFVFLTNDNANVVCVPTSEVLLNVKRQPQLSSVVETVQYYGPESRAIALNTVTRVSLGTDEEFVRRKSGLIPEHVFCIVSKSHAFVLECQTSEEARYFADAWTFFLYHSRPVQVAKNKFIAEPVTFGTRTGVAF